MGRELRRVPANWDHPKCMRQRGTVDYQPMVNSPFGPEMRQWITEWEAWERGERPDSCTDENKALPFWEWSGSPPDPLYHRPDWKPEEMTWFQVYETVSEGTPVTPPFATKEELVDYLVANGDFWDQKRREEGNSFMNCEPWTRQQAEAFVGCGHAMSFAAVDGRVMSGVEFLAEQAAA